MGKTDRLRSRIGSHIVDHEREDREPQPQPVASPVLACVLAWLFPGLGHLFLGRKLRAVIFCALILAFLLLGVGLDGRLYDFENATRLLHKVAALGAMGAAIPWAVLELLVDYQGDPAAASYEYGTAFLITAGVMNLLLVLDAWDIAAGWKE